MTRPNHDNREFVALVVRSLDGLASPDEQESLEEQLRSDPQKIQLYNDLCLQVHLLEDDVVAAGREPSGSPALDHLSDTARTGAEPDGSRRSANTDARHPKSLTFQRVLSWAVAAAVLVGVGMGAAIIWSGMQPGGAEVANQPIPAGLDDAFLATLVDVSDDVTWSFDHDMPREPGNGLTKGWMRLDTGVIDIAFRSGAIVQLEGPAMFGIDSCLRATLEYGNVDVYAPESATSFTVNTSAMEVVDLGTRFSMQVDEDSGQANVSVSEGQVDLHVGNAGHNASIHALMEGQSASVGGSGELLDLPEQANENDTGSIGLLAHWSFNEVGEQAEHGGLIADSSPHGLNGRVLKSSDSSENEIRSVAGLDGRALDLSHRGAVDLSEHADKIGTLKQFTIAAWVRNPDNMIFAISNAMDRHRIQFERHLNCLVYGWQNNGQWDAVRAVVDGGWKADQWYHVVVTASHGSVTLYRDGQSLLGPRSTGVLLGTPIQRPIDLGQKNTVLIGKADRSKSDHLRHPGWIPEQFFGGQIDDLQIYNTALDADAIRYLHENPGKIYQTTTTSSP